MDANAKQHYLADSPPTVVRLEIKPHFEALKDEKLKRYAHFMSRLALFFSVFPFLFPVTSPDVLEIPLPLLSLVPYISQVTVYTVM